jgi:hypothetical protein
VAKPLCAWLREYNNLHVFRQSNRGKAFSLMLQAGSDAALLNMRAAFLTIGSVGVGGLAGLAPKLLNRRYVGDPNKRIFLFHAVDFGRYEWRSLPMRRRFCYVRGV